DRRGGGAGSTRGRGSAPHLVHAARCREADRRAPQASALHGEGQGGCRGRGGAVSAPYVRAGAVLLPEFPGNTGAAAAAEWRAWLGGPDGPGGAGDTRR